MIDEPNLALRIVQLESTFNLYKPMLKELQGASSITKSMSQIQNDLQFLRESRIKTKGKLVNLLKDQDKLYKDTTQVLQDREKLIGIEVTKRFGGFEIRLEKIEESLDAFRSKGWDALLRIIPWVIATSATAWALFK
ncbi:MAG: hypothetical protein IMF19_11295 [Proteobacteria bacterium]|nr:hypothetical protein [Pseudomonadota bacterium]